MTAFASDRAWDVVIIGAGVAGAATAAWLSRYSPSLSVLLIERSQWPRAKVCGCCVNPAGVSLLRDLGLGDQVAGRSTPIDRVNVRVRGNTLTLRHPGGVAMSRETMDEMLVDHARAHGARFACRVSAQLMESREGIRHIRLVGATGDVKIAARQVVVADGLQGKALTTIDESGFDPIVGSCGRIGLATIFGTYRAQPGVVRLHVDRTGYVGLVDLLGGKTCLAAAIDPTWVRSVGGAEQAIKSLLVRNDPVLADLELSNLRGTHFLTRSRRRVACPGVFVVGDAARFTEPLSGEGMTWALVSACVLARLVARVAEQKSAEASMRAMSAWTIFNVSTLRRRQRWSAFLRCMTRRPKLLAALGLVGSRIPAARRITEGALQWSARPYSCIGLRATQPWLPETLA